MQSGETHLSYLTILLLCCIGATIADSENQREDPIKHVHVIFMNHLDVGYSFNNLPGHVLEILNAYFTEYFPRAINTALKLIALGYRERFIYTTHPWLVSLYLDCPPNVYLSGIHLKCPSTDERQEFIKAVQIGVITWHAGPMNMEFEMLDESMMEYAIQMSFDLDKQFNITRKHRTVSQRDVPGTTVAILPILKKMGVEALSIGVNGATVPAAVPPVFRWQFANTSMITLYHPGGYPNGYGPSPLSPGGLSRKDCTIVPGLDHALCFAFRSDNQGPPKDYQEVLTVYDIVRSQFPNAIVEASTFETFTGLLKTFESELPVFTQEMGDVWIQGGGSDPRKTAQMRAMYRARADCLKQGICSLSDPKLYNASRFMLKLAEHTWGSAGNSVDNIHWTNTQFDKLINIPDGMYWNATTFWEEQREFADLAIQALGPQHPLTKLIFQEFAKFEPEVPNLEGFHAVPVGSDITCGQMKMVFDSRGALVKLVDPSNRNWADVDNPIGLFVYQTYNQSDFDKLADAYLPYSKHFFLGIGKPNISQNASPVSKYWDNKVEQLFLNQDSTSVIVIVSLVDMEALRYYGAPLKVMIQYQCHKQGIELSVEWIGKRPTRMPEGLNFVFMPTNLPQGKWYLNKINELIDPLNVVVNGSQRLHGINRGVYYVDKGFHGLSITSPDSALVNILTDEDFVSALQLPLSPIKSVTGVAFNMYNNVWETNYIFWYPYRKMDINQKFRFTLNFL